MGAVKNAPEQRKHGEASAESCWSSSRVSAFDAALLQPGKRRVGGKNCANRNAVRVPQNARREPRHPLHRVAENGQRVHRSPQQDPVRPPPGRSHPALSSAKGFSGYSQRQLSCASWRTCSSKLMSSTRCGGFTRGSASAGSGSARNGAAERGQVLLLKRGAFRGGMCTVPALMSDRRWHRAARPGDECQPTPSGSSGTAGSRAPLTLRVVILCRVNGQGSGFGRRLLRVLLGSLCTKDSRPTSSSAPGRTVFQCTAFAACSVILLGEPAQWQRSRYAGAGWGWQ